MASSRYYAFARARAADMPKACLTRAELADELSIAESTVSDFVRRGVLPKPVYLSSGCVRWRWSSVDAALAAREGITQDAPGTDADAGVRRAIEAAQDRSNR